MGYALPKPHIALMIGTNVFPLSDSVYLTFGGTCGYSLRIGSTNKFSTAILAHLFARFSLSILHMALAMRLVCLLNRTKNLRQSEGLFYQRFL